MEIKFTDISILAPETRGIYMWYLEFTDQDQLYTNLETIIKSYIKKEYDVIVSTKFQESYIGKIVGFDMINIQDYQPKVKDFICSFLNNSVTIPLYIGLTVEQNLKKRLTDHANTIIKIRDNINLISNDKDDFDNSFAYRIQKEFNHQGMILNESYLRVKCFSLPNYTTEEIQNIEKILKLFYKPIFGVK